MTKQEKIKQGYGIYSDIALGLCDENGWIKGSEYYTYFPQNKDKKIGIDEYIYFRPKSLSGIDDNNGWIKIESKEDFPKQSGVYFTVLKEDLEQSICTFSIDDIGYSHKYWKENVLYYQGLKEPQPPIY